MAAIALAVAATEACNTEPTRPSVRALRAPAAAPASLEEHDASPANDVPTAEALSELQVSLAPGMRELLRGESALPLAVDLPRASVDTCLRIVVAARVPTIAALMTEGRTAAISVSSTRALLDAKGPVCVQKGAPLRLEAQGTPSPDESTGVARYVVWVAP